MTINSVDQSTINVVLNNAKTLETEKTAKASLVIKAEDTAAASVNTAANADTLQLSTQAQTYLDAIESEETTSVSAETSASAEDSEESVEDLYTYTESQLKELLINGDISQSDYNAEIARRGE